MRPILETLLWTLIVGLSYGQPTGNCYCKPVIPMESKHCEGLPFGVITYHISRIPNGEPQTHQKFRSLEIYFIHPIRHREIR